MTEVAQVGFISVYFLNRTDLKKSLNDGKSSSADNEAQSGMDESHNFILDPAQTVIYDSFMKAYAELLSRLVYLNV